MARHYLESAEPEDDGLTEFSMAASQDNLCYVDAESAIAILDWIESLIRRAE
jgi:hypothetical protein